MSGSRGGGTRGPDPPPPLKNHKNIGIHSNAGHDPLKNHKATKPGGRNLAKTDVCLSLFSYTILFMICLLSCQPRVTVMSCFVYKVIRDLESIDHLCINPIHRIGLIHK